MTELIRYERVVFKKRRREVEACLRGLSAKRLGFPRSLKDTGAAPGRTLADALRRLGPTFVTLGSYLASRMDLLGEDVRRELAVLDAEVPPAPLPAVQELVARELGPAGEEAFAHFQPWPDESRPLCQTHRARLLNGEWVDVKLVRPEVDESIAYDLELLPELLGVLSRLAGRHGCRLDVAVCLADLRRALVSEVELLDEADALSALGRDADRSAPWVVPQVYAELGTSRLLVRGALPGGSLGRLVAEPQEGSRELAELARTLARSWLRQVLSGQVFPVDPGPRHVGVSPDGKIVFRGGAAVYPTPSFQRHLHRYLDAIVAQDPDEAFSAMVSEMAVTAPDAEGELRRRFRQLLPFRDGPQDFHGDQLAGYLLLHWRLAAARGYQPRPLLLAFYQGLYRIRKTLERLDPRRDALCEAFGELCLDGELGRWREVMDPRKVSVELRQYAVLLAELPRKMDEALARAARGDVRVKLRLGEEERSLASNAPAIALALLPVFVAVTILVRHLAGAPAFAGWSEKLGALVLVLLGGWLLGAVGRCG